MKQIDIYKKRFKVANELLKQLAFCTQKLILYMSIFQQSIEFLEEQEVYFNSLDHKCIQSIWYCVCQEFFHLNQLTQDDLEQLSSS